MGVAENLANLKQSLVNGKKIDILKIDPPVNPATVLGMDDQTRLNSNITLSFINVYLRIQWINWGFK